MNKGFTLIELLVCITVLVLIILPLFSFSPHYETVDEKIEEMDYEKMLKFNSMQLDNCEEEHESPYFTVFSNDMITYEVFETCEEFNRLFYLR